MSPVWRHEMCGACAVTKVILNNLDLRHIHLKNNRKVTLMVRNMQRFIVNIKLVVPTAVVMNCTFRGTMRSGMYNLGLVIQYTMCENSGFRRGVIGTVALQGCYIAYIGSRLSKFRDSQTVPIIKSQTSCLVLEDATHKLSQNVGMRCITPLKIVGLISQSLRVYIWLTSYSHKMLFLLFRSLHLQREGPGTIIGQYVWDLWWRKWQSGKGF
jgi:hypothetical protein